MGYQLETTALISKENYNTFRISCIMLILENLQVRRNFHDIKKMEYVCELTELVQYNPSTPTPIEIQAIVGYYFD